MKLKQQFNEALTKRLHIDKCEKIADEHAINFIRWLDARDFDGKTYEELLEIYKNQQE